MIIDSFLQFTGLATATNIGNVDGTDSPTTGTQTSSNQIDLHMAGIPVLTTGQGARDIGIGDNPAMKLVVWVTSTFSGGTSMTVSLQGSTDNGAGGTSGYVTYYSAPFATLATLLQGAMLMNMDMPRPPNNVPPPRFLRLQYVTTGTWTGGALRGCLVVDRFDQISTGIGFVGAYPPGITIAN